MKTETTGTLIDGMVQLDEALDAPNHSRVNVSVTPPTHDPEKAKAALKSLFKRADEWAFDSQGLRFTRDELHERD